MTRRKWPMWRKRQKNYVFTPDRFDKKIKLLDTPLEYEMDDREPNYTEVDFVPYQESGRESDGSQ